MSQAPIAAARGAKKGGEGSICVSGGLTGLETEQQPR